jgi:rhodanese-related sulfurtransferase
MGGSQRMLGGTRGGGRQEAHAAFRAGVQLLDVREPSEGGPVNALGARHAPVGHLRGPAWAVCRAGNRSARVTLSLIRPGPEAVSLNGDMRMREAAGLPRQPEMRSRARWRETARHPSPGAGPRGRLVPSVAAARS